MANATGIGGSLFNTFAGVATGNTAIIGTAFAMLTSKLNHFSDEYQVMLNKINGVSANPEAAQSMLDGVLEIANRSRAPIDEVAKGFCGFVVHLTMLMRAETHCWHSMRP